MPFFQRVGDRGSEIALPCRLSDRYQGYLRGCVCRQRKESCYEKQLIQCRKGVSCHVGVPTSKFNRFHYHYNYYMGIYIYICNTFHVISGCLSTRHGASSGCGWRNGLLYVG